MVRSFPTPSTPSLGWQLGSRGDTSLYSARRLGFCRQKVGCRGQRCMMPGDLGHLSAAVGACWPLFPLPSLSLSGCALASCLPFLERHLDHGSRGPCPLHWEAGCPLPPPRLFWGSWEPRCTGLGLQAITVWWERRWGRPGGLRARPLCDDKLPQGVG